MNQNDVLFLYLIKLIFLSLITFAGSNFLNILEPVLHEFCTSFLTLAAELL